MSLLAISSTALFIADITASKRASLALKRIRLDSKPRAISWSTDNSTFFVATVDTIYSFLSSSPSSESAVIYVAPQGQTLQSILLCRDTSTVIFAQGPSIHLLSLGTKPRVSNTLIGHSSPIVSLSLSNDGSLLASASLSGTLCIHNLNHNSLTLLKGFPVTTSTSKRLVCAFHSHNRTRVFVGCGRVFAIYDVTRPSNPIKTIKFSEIPLNSFILAIVSSPFSKPLLAVAFSSGQVALVDLEKDRSLLKVLDVNTPITAMDFTLDGTAIVLGTGSGKIIVKGWRSAEEDDQMIALNENGGDERVIALSIQRRVKQPRHSSQSNNTLTINSKLNHPLHELKNTTYPNRHIASRSPVEFGSQTSKISSTRNTSPTLSAALRADATETNAHMREPSKPTHLRMSSTENDATSVIRSQMNSRPATQVKKTLSNAALTNKPHDRVESINSRIASKADISSGRPESPQIKDPSDSLKTNDVGRTTSVLGSDGVQEVVESQLRFASQDLVSESAKLNDDASQPTQARGISAMLAEKKEKQVEWMVAGKSIRPKRPNTLMEPSSDAEVSGEEFASNIRPETSQTGLPKTSLHKLLRETLNECRDELREDIRGLHLDVLRMGRTWKNELRLLMDQHARDLKTLAEENAQLKRENDGLRQRL